MLQTAKNTHATSILIIYVIAKVLLKLAIAPKPYLWQFKLINKSFALLSKSSLCMNISHSSSLYICEISQQISRGTRY